MKAMRVPSREFESRALSEIRALPGPRLHPFARGSKVTGWRMSAPHEGGSFPSLLLYDPLRCLLEPPLENDLSTLQVLTY